MNIQIIKDTEMPTDLTGGEYSSANIDIYVDSDLDIRTQRLLVIHSVIENYCRSWVHSKVEELEGFIGEALDQLAIE